MNSIVAVDGLAEAAFTIAELAFVAVLLASAGLLVAAFRYRSVVAVILACILVATLGWLYRPWMAFNVVPSADPVDVSAVASFKMLAAFWVLVSFAGAASLGTTVFRRRAS